MPFIFLIPAVFIGGLIELLNSKVLVTGEATFNLTPPTEIVAGCLLVVGIWVGRDLYKTFLRTVSEEIWITDRDIIWIGKDRRVLRKAMQTQILRLTPAPGHREKAWRYRIDTAEGPITFTTGMEHADELIDRIDSFLAKSGTL